MLEAGEGNRPLGIVVGRRSVMLLDGAEHLDSSPRRWSSAGRCDDALTLLLRARTEGRPERFLEARPATYNWLAFGGGIRRCIGASFATLEMRIVLHTVARRLQLAAAERRGEPPDVRAIFYTPASGPRSRSSLVCPRGAPRDGSPRQSNILC